MIPDRLAPPVDYAIPEESGSVLITPAPQEIAGVLRAAQDRAWGNGRVLGEPLGEFRRRVRARALALAAEYMRRHDPSQPARAAGPLILMGHQPLFFHPGVWMKFFLLSRLAAEHRATGLHLIVDTDATGPIIAEVPSRSAGGTPFRRVSEELAAIPEDTPLEAVPPPDPGTWRAFVERVRAHLETLPSPEFAARLTAYAAGEAGARGPSRTLAEFLAALRRRYEAQAGPCGYLELPVSVLADTPEFRAFALHLLRAPEELYGIYNASLDEYRRLHRLRSSANPFPNLSRDGVRFETPFWVLRGGTRADLLAGRQGNTITLGAADGPIAAVPADGVDALAAAGIRLRPKAMTLTLFARLCLGDLFIHGVSGGRYDRVTDVISERLFGRRPPAYIVASATLHPPLLAGARTPEPRHVLERRVMDLRHNPDRHLAAPSDDERRLVEEKWALIRQVETMRPGPDRRAATRRIREVNEALARALAPEISTLEAQLAAQEPGGTEAAVLYRGYAFFLFDPSEVRGLAGEPQ